MNRSILLSLLAALLLTCAAQADTIIPGGNVSGTWTLAGSPYIVTGRITLPAGQSLNIQPGVQVFFDRDTQFEIWGSLHAVGAPGDSILFSRTANADHWHGLQMFYAGPSILSYCIIEHCGHSHYEHYGSGILLNHSSPEITYCTIRFNDTRLNGGGISCDSSSHAVITDNIIAGNKALYHGAGISCIHSSQALIARNYIHDNVGYPDECLGGGVYAEGSSPLITANIILANQCEEGCGIHLGPGSYATVLNNLIIENVANEGGNEGAGITCWGATAMIKGNVIKSSWAPGGGGMYIHDPIPSPLVITENQFINNSGGTGAILLWGQNVRISRNLFTANQGTGWYNNASVLSCNHVAQCLNNTYSRNLSRPTLSFHVSGSHVFQDINWLETVPIEVEQGYSVQVNYSNIQNGWPGLGNINAYPAFVDTAHNDYRLLWGSPCIDSGHPDSLDPDGTRADMGAFYFDQSVPVRVLLTPHQIPYLIPAGGGSLNFTLRLDNWTDAPHSATVWCDQTLPDSSTSNPLLGPVTVTVAAHTLLARVRTQTVPASAPLGVYHYNAYAVVGPDTSKDSFMFGKTGSGLRDSGSGAWSNTGESIPSETLASESLLPLSFGLLPASPNPFNPTTAISYQLQAASQVRLTVWDTAGRLVGTLMDGIQEAGQHSVTFDGSALASGLYFVMIQSGTQTAIQKIVLMK